MNSLKILAFCLIFLNLIHCKPAHSITQTPETGMFKISIMYPGAKDSHFDMAYYEKNHMPMMAGFLGKNLKFYEIDRGIAGRSFNDEPTYTAIGYFYCYDTAEYNKAVAQHIDTILKDVRKYTNQRPLVQISQISQLVAGKP